MSTIHLILRATSFSSSAIAAEQTCRLSSTQILQRALSFLDGVSENRRSGIEHRPKTFVCRIPMCTTQTGINYLSR